VISPSILNFNVVSAEANRTGTDPMIVIFVAIEDHPLDVERKMAPGEGLFSLRLPKFESYQPSILNSCAAMLFTLAHRQCQAKSCRSCTLATPQLQREPSLLRHFGQIGRNSPGNTRGF
jgi:hypothetical protein